MGSIISSGVGSGLDIAGLVAKLVEAEGRPQATRLDSQEAKAQAKLSAFGSLRSALSTFRGTIDTLTDLESFRGRKVELSGKEFLSATATGAAAPGSYQIEVQSLASAHRLASATYGSATEVIGTGTLTIARGATSFTVEIASGSDTLAAIAAAINDAANNPGVFATVVTGTAGARLVLASGETGAVNDLVVTQSGGDGGLADLVYDPDGSGIENLVELEPAADAAVLIDGFAATSATNTIEGAIEGVSIDLVAANELGETTTVRVSFDRAAARATLDKLVSGYNKLLDAIDSLAGYDPETRQAGPLFGDAGLRNLGFQLRRELNAAVAGVAGPFTTLTDLGIKTELDGRLSIDGTKLDAALAADFDAVGGLFATEDTGIAVRIDALLEPYLEGGGVFDARDGTLKAQIADIGERREALDLRLQSLQARLLKQFNALDSLLGQLQTTSTFLNQQLSNLPGFAPYQARK